MNEELPLNRKERFFTGTVLPMIVCRDGFKHLHALLELVGCHEPLSVCATAGQENIQFFSEYSFVESVVGEARKREYEVSSDRTLAENNRNWFYIRDFVDLVDQVRSPADKSLVQDSQRA
jgi:hypothetical protein